MILKGILLYSTIALLIISVCAIDSMSLGILLIDVLLISALIKINCKYISQEEFEKLLFSKYLKDKEDDDNKEN